jgi:hypothetical protein
VFLGNLATVLSTTAMVPNPTATINAAAASRTKAVLNATTTARTAAAINATTAAGQQRRCMKQLAIRTAMAVDGNVLCEPQTTVPYRVSRKSFTQRKDGTRCTE